MFNLRKEKNIFVIGTVVLFLCGVVLAQNSLFLNTTSQQRGRFNNDGDSGVGSGNTVSSRPMILADEIGAANNEGDPVLQASWITVEEPRPKNFRVHDLVTIIVNEVSRHSTSAETETEREYGIKASLDEWFRLTNGAVHASTAAHGRPSLKLNADREFQGSGDITRQDSLTARIRAEVVDVLPNGNLMLEATHSITTDDETTMITLTGICSGNDLSLDNTVLSTQLADLQIEKTHTGQARDATRRGILSGLLDFINPL